MIRVRAPALPVPAAPSSRALGAGLRGWVRAGQAAEGRDGGARHSAAALSPGQAAVGALLRHMLVPHRAGQQGAADHIPVRLVIRDAGWPGRGKPYVLCFYQVTQLPNKVQLRSRAQHTPAGPGKLPLQALNKYTN